MEKLRGKINGAKVFFRTDWNIVRAKRLVKRGCKAAPRGVVRCFTNKVPFVEWIALYNFKWLPYDVLAGITAGIVLVLQAVNIAMPIPAGISIQQTLLASWLPGFIYAITGTSKDISVGPTSSSVLLSLQLVGGINAASGIPSEVILPALTLAVSGWFLIFGLLGLGFVFDLIPTFLCIAIVTALAIIVTTLQLPIFLGLLGVPNTLTAVFPAVIKNITNVSGQTIAISASALAFLGVLSFLKTKWGKERSAKGALARMGVAGGGLIVIVLFAVVSSIFLRDLPVQQQVAPFVPPPPAPGMSEGSLSMASTQAAPAMNSSAGGVAMINAVLRGPAARSVRRQVGPSAADVPMEMPTTKLPFWAAFPEFNTPIPTARVPRLELAKNLFLSSFLVFIVLNIEHIVVARFFAHEHGYTISKSQEMFSLGAINLANSFFGGVPVGGGDMVRSSILGFTGVKSPLNQIFASITVLIAMLLASDALRYFPQAALAALVFVAVVDQMPPQALISTYFKLSFADFVAFFLAMNIAVPAPAPINGIAGIILGVIFMIIYTLFRIMFKRPKVLTSEDLEALCGKKQQIDGAWMAGDEIPLSTLVVKPDGDIIFTNAERMRRRIMDAAYLNNSGRVVELIDAPERPWNFGVDSYISAVRRRHRAADSEAVVVFRPRLRTFILDMSSTTFIDSSALMCLELLKKQLRDWAGETVEFRFVGLNKHLKRRFERAKWQIVDPFGPRVVDNEADKSNSRDIMFDSLPEALRYISSDNAMNLDGTFEQDPGRTIGIADNKSFE